MKTSGTQAEEIGVEGYLLKPVNASLLYDTLVGSVRRRRTRGRTVPACKARATPLSITPPGIRVLLVEDNEMNQQVATELLESAGAIVTVANHGGEAVKILTEGRSASAVRRGVDGPADARDGRVHGHQAAAARSALCRSSRSSR